MLIFTDTLHASYALSFRVRVLIVAFILLTCMTAAESTLAQTATSFSGTATGVISKGTQVVERRNVPNPSRTESVFDESLGDTGHLSLTGGRLTNGALQGNLQIGITTGVVDTITSGGAQGIVDGGNENTSQAQSIVNNFNLALTGTTNVSPNGVRVSADKITANTYCSCASACTGNSVITNLRVNGELVGGNGYGSTPIPVESGITATRDSSGNIILTATPNSMLTFQGVRLILNQQSSTGVGDITIKALQFHAETSVRTIQLFISTTEDITVAQSHSGIMCSECVYTLSPNTIPFSAAGGSGSFNVISSDAACPYTVASNDSFLSITSGTSGTGNGTVSFAVAANAGPVRTGTITAADRTFSISQAALPTVTINNVTRNEGNSGTTAFTFTISLSAPSEQSVTVDYATANGTAGDDYITTSGTLTFAAGEVNKNLTVPVIGDTLVEGSETFTVNLSNANNAVINTGQAIG